MSLEVDSGICSQRGVRDSNEDFAALVHPAHQDEALGLIAAVADGVSSGGGGCEASRSTVRSILQDYHATPATWDTTVALDRLIGAQNAWLADHNRRRQGAAGGGISAMCTLTVLVLRGHGYAIAHVGDTRCWRVRGDECLQLTQDHCLDHPDLRSQLTRAVGLDHHVHVDYVEGDLQAGDLFVLSSDGVHGVLKRSQIAELARRGGAQQAAEAIVEAALDAGSRDNATAMVIRVLGLAPERLDDLLRRGRQLPAPPRMKAGDTLDDYTITALLSDNGVHRLYRAHDRRDGAPVVLKALHEARASDPQERAMLAHEAWLGQWLTARDPRGFMRVHEPRDPTAFYVVFDWHEGQTLEQMLAQGRQFTVGEIVEGILAVAQALGRLHRLGVVHRDVKPGNLHRGADGQWRLFDLGVAVSARAPEALRHLHAGTPSYMNPEQWSGGVEGGGEPADGMSDLYALGVTLYQWLTGRLPYGEIEPWQTGRYRQDPRPPSRLRPDVPIWLDHVALKAVAREKARRFETAEEFALALQRGASRALPAPGATPLVARDPAALWKIGLALSLLFNVLLVVWLLFLPR